MSYFPSGAVRFNHLQQFFLHTNMALKIFQKNCLIDFITVIYGDFNPTLFTKTKGSLFQNRVAGHAQSADKFLPPFPGI